MAIKYYRPYLTIEEVTYLAKLIEANEGNSKLYDKLAKLAGKANAGLISASHTIHSIEDKLGMIATADSSPEIRRRAAYEKKIAGMLLTAEEKELAETYEWENNLSQQEHNL